MSFLRQPALLLTHALYNFAFFFSQIREIERSRDNRLAFLGLLSLGGRQGQQRHLKHERERASVRSSPTCGERNLYFATRISSNSTCSKAMESREWSAEVVDFEERSSYVWVVVVLVHYVWVCFLRVCWIERRETVYELWGKKCENIKENELESTKWSD